MRWNVLSAWRALMSKCAQYLSGGSKKPARSRSKTPTHLLLGTRGEKIAVSYLRRRRHRILACNFSTQHGEIDIVSKFSGVIVFTEVKSSVQSEGFAPRDRVDAAKKRKLAQLSTIFLRKRKLEGLPVRFDIVEVSFADENDRHPEVVHIPAAF